MAFGFRTPFSFVGESLSGPEGSNLAVDEEFARYRLRRHIRKFEAVNVTGQFLEPYLGSWLPLLYRNSYIWTALGFFGNVLFSSRFILQWLSSERKGCLVVPAYFWHLSFWGSVINLVYALHIDNAPIIFGVIALPFIYGRNLILLRRTAETSVQVRKSERSLEARLKPA